ncbi:MAG: tetratricopeptide repeat protein, partial [Elusimicrobia bacterium]|nr:tetratricopeptide repeat protein [Elusimicrobiota bacterium]
RLGEAAYNAKDWGPAIEEWRKVEKDYGREYGKTYIVPESWMGIIFANLALEQFSQAEANLFLLGETYPNYLKVPEVLYAQGIVNLHKPDYPSAERALRLVHTPEALFYLGKTYLLSKRPFLAAATFEQLIREFPDSVLKEETEFFIGDSFFLAKDFDGAITKYQRFLAQYPDSQLKVSAVFRIGSSHFQKRNFIEARAHFQSVIDRYPRDFFAPLAQYFIAESYLTADQFREALFAYTNVITKYPETIKISPLAHYKLAWSQYQVGDWMQTAQTCRNFLQLYPTNSLAKNIYLILGNSLLQLKQYNEGITAFMRIIDLAPTSDVAEQALLTILQTQYQQKHFNSILTSYQFIFRHLPPSQSKWRPMSNLYAAEAYLEMGRVEEAKAIYEMILKVYPNDAAAFYAQDGLAWAYSFLGDDAKALEERRKLKDMLQLARSSATFSGRNELGIADSMYNQKEFEEAQDLYAKFVRENPKAPEAPLALYQAGMSLYHLRYYTDAIEKWRQLREQYPEAPETPKAEYQIADTLYRQQKYAESVAAYKRIVEKYPRSKELPFAYLRIAQAHFYAGEDAAAVQQCQALLARFASSPEAADGLDLMELVFDRAPSFDFKRALGAVVEGAPHTPAGGDAQFRIARRFFEAKKFADAAAEFQKFSVDYTGSPQLKKAQFLLAESYFNAGKYGDSVFAFQRFLDNFPKNEDTALAVFHLASAHYGMKDYEPAAQHYQRLLDEYPDSEYAKPAQYNLALSYKATGKLDRAQEAFARYANQAGAKDESGRGALWEVFGLMKDQKKYTDALTTLDRLTGEDSDPETSIEAVYHKGEVLILMNQKDEAVRTWETLVAKDPKNSSYRLQGLIELGKVYEDAQDYGKAISIYEDLARNAPAAQTAKAARERAEGLKRLQNGKGGGAAPPKRAPAPRPRWRARPRSCPRMRRGRSLPRPSRPLRLSRPRRRPRSRRRRRRSICPVQIRRPYAGYQLHRRIQRELHARHPFLLLDDLHRLHHRALVVLPESRHQRGRAAGRPAQIAPGRQGEGSPGLALQEPLSCRAGSPLRPPQPRPLQGRPRGAARHQETGGAREDGALPERARDHGQHRPLHRALRHGGGHHQGLPGPGPLGPRGAGCGGQGHRGGPRRHRRRHGRGHPSCHHLQLLHAEGEDDLGHDGGRLLAPPRHAGGQVAPRAYGLKPRPARRRADHQHQHHASCGREPGARHHLHGHRPLRHPGGDQGPRIAGQRSCRQGLRFRERFDQAQQGREADHQRKGRRLRDAVRPRAGRADAEQGQDGHRVGRRREQGRRGGRYPGCRQAGRGHEDRDPARGGAQGGAVLGGRSFSSPGEGAGQARGAGGCMRRDDDRFAAFEEELMVGINVTPLVDVCLVLVIIFMVTAPLLTRPAFEVKLPAARTQEGEEKDKISISLGTEGRMAVDSAQAPTIAKLKRLLAYKLAASESRLVVIRADKDATHGRLTEVMAAAKDAGARSITIATERRKQ